MIRFRKWLANKLARTARRIYPESPEVMAFWADRMTDFVISGKSDIKITVVKQDDLYAAPEQQGEKK